MIIAGLMKNLRPQSMSRKWRAFYYCPPQQSPVTTGANQQLYEKPNPVLSLQTTPLRTLWPGNKLHTILPSRSLPYNQPGRWFVSELISLAGAGLL